MNKPDTKPKALAATRDFTRRALLKGSVVLGGAAAVGFPYVISVRGQTKPARTWKIQTSWPGGIGLEAFKEWAKTIADKTDGELAFEPFGAKEVVGDFQLFDAVKNGVLEAMNPFTLYWAGRMPASVFLSSYPLGPRSEGEWDVFFYGLKEHGTGMTGRDIARELFKEFNMFYVGHIHHGPNIIHSKVPIRSFEDFEGRKMRVPGGMVAELFQAAGARTTLLPGGEIFPALERGTIDVADYVGPAINYALGFHQVTQYISMGPPGFMSIYQPVDLMDLTVRMDVWNALPKHLQEFVEREVHRYSDMHFATIQQADQEAWKKFQEAGSVVTRLSAEDVEKFTRVAVPLWFNWANRDKNAARVFKLQLDYMRLPSLGYVTADMIKDQELKWDVPGLGLKV